MKFNKNKLQVTPSSFRDALQLEKAIAKAISASSLKIGFDSLDANDIANAEISDDTLGEVIKTMLTVVVDDSVEKALFDCAKKANYDKEKITEDFFENVENRELYFPIMIEIVKVNVGPFVKSLFSQFGGLIGNLKGILK